MGNGALAQLGERRLCKPKVTGSIPVRSIGHLQGFPRKAHHSAASDLDRGAGTFSKRTLPAGTIQVIASTASRPSTDPSSMIGVMHRE
jgi:hypothetical protein